MLRFCSYILCFLQIQVRLLQSDRHMVRRNDMEKVADEEGATKRNDAKRDSRQPHNLTCIAPAMSIAAANWIWIYRMRWANIPRTAPPMESQWNPKFGRDVVDPCLGCIAGISMGMSGLFAGTKPVMEIYTSPTKDQDYQDHIWCDMLMKIWAFGIAPKFPDEGQCEIQKP